MSSVITWFVIFFCSVGFLSGFVPKNTTPFTDMTAREYRDGAVAPDDSADRYVSIRALDEGREIYTPTEDRGGYRYGPTIFSNADGSLDAFFASSGCCGRWDFINYMHSPDGGKNWTDEKKVLEPTPDSPDFYSCCDPGVVKIGKYWYIGYTSTIDERGVFNHVFVARSENIDGPYEKWNGNGWGGDPQPVITFTGGKDEWGAGEPSFVVRDSKLYMYYTWKTSLNETRVSIADAGSENWPATLEYSGTAIRYSDMGSDSADVKYVDDYGRFVAVCTASRFTPDSYIDVFVSDDGLNFTESCRVRTNVAACCHNCGISSRTNGHIRLSDKKYLGYAYGSEWGNWSTRLNEITIALTDAPDFADDSVRSQDIPVVGKPKTYAAGFSGIVCEDDLYECRTGNGETVNVYCMLSNITEHKKVSLGITFSGYDENIIRMSGRRIIPVSEGTTNVTVRWNGYTTEIKVRVSA